MPETLIYIAPNGTSPFETWFSTLHAQAAAKITTAITRLEQGHTAQLKPVGQGVLEYRIDWGPGYRIYLARDGDRLIILLTGGTKQRQQSDISAAQAMWTDYKRRRPKPPPKGT